MDKKLDIYFEAQNDNAKLVHIPGLLWGKINSELDFLLSDYNLNVSKFNILMIIKHLGQQNGIQQNEISKRLLVTPSNITKLLDKLEKENMITRNSKTNDKRVKLIKITSSASELLDKVWPLYLEKVCLLTKLSDKKDVILLEKLAYKWLCDIV